MEKKNSLNPAQHEAVTTTEGPLLILAGAGSGKTRVIIHRIAYLVREKKVAPYNIMAVTFTNKAAQEMRKRITAEIGSTGEEVFIKTFHSAAVFILRRYGSAIGLPSTFSIYDSSDQETVIKEILSSMNIDVKKVRPSYIASKISEIKDKVELLEGVDPSSMFPRDLPVNFASLYEEYHRRLAAHCALDFNDLLIKTVKLLRESPDTLALLQHKWRYLMIDEYQDTNRAQYLISKMLASGHRNICVVGDDDQSIYSWRGADIRNILDFEKDYPEAKVVRLEYNYRSTRQILDSASAVIANNSERKGKDLISFRGDGERPVWCQTNNEYGESEFAINTILTIKKQEGYSNRDFAIFYRTNAQSRVFEDALRRENIPYRIVGGLKFYDRKEIKDILAYMRFIVNPYDTVAMMRVINTPARGIGAKTLEKLRETAYMHQMSEWEAIDKQLPIDGKQSKGLTIFRKFMIDALDEYAQVPDTLKLTEFVMHIIEKSGYHDFLASDKSVEGQSRLENVEEFMNSIYEYQERNPEANPEEFLQEVSLLTTEENPVKDTPGDPTNVVTMMTVHNAKGLEFPVVFLTGLEEDMFPHYNCRDNEQMIEEERRLCYVGITRAMDRLFITSAELRRSYSGEVNYRTPSRFIDEIPADLLIVKNHRETQRSGSSFSSGSTSGKGDRFFNYQPSFGNRQQSQPRPKPASSSRFSVNSRVLHPKFGPGKIIAIQGTGDDVRLTILFDSSGLKSFLEKYTPLEQI